MGIYAENSVLPQFGPALRKIIQRSNRSVLAPATQDWRRVPRRDRARGSDALRTV